MLVLCFRFLSGFLLPSAWAYVVQDGCSDSGHIPTSWKDQRVQGTISPIKTIFGKLHMNLPLTSSSLEIGTWPHLAANEAQLKIQGFISENSKGKLPLGDSGGV